MAWILITIDRVKAQLAGAELDALQTSALADGQSDPLPEIIGHVVQMVRGYVAAHPENVLGAGDTIPDELAGAALALIRRSAASRLPGSPFDSEIRAAEARAAERLFERVADGRYQIAQPANADPVEKSGGGATVVTSRPNIATREHTDGL